MKGARPYAPTTPLRDLYAAAYLAALQARSAQARRPVPDTPPEGGTAQLSGPR